MSVARRVRSLGLRIEIADLGASGVLRAEYDARARTIRISERRLRELHGRARRCFLVEAVAHELFHHLEYVGGVERYATRLQREDAAERFARAAIS